MKVQVYPIFAFMHFNRLLLQEAIAHYRTDYLREEEFIPAFISLLHHPLAFSRAHLPGHITASAWIVDESKRRVLLTHHTKLGRWLQPGGHADGEENVFLVALKETQEETGLSGLTPLLYAIFDLDVHIIPARKDMPEHLHFDIRFLFQADASAELTITEESLDLKWVPADALPSYTGDNESMMRMADKVRALFPNNQ